MAATALPAFQELLDAHGPVVWRVCRAALGAADGADCFQDTMLAALRAYPALRHGDNLRGWLLTIAHHQVIDHHRRRGRRREAPLETGSVADAGSDPARLVRDDPAGYDAELWEQVRELPTKQRAAVVQRYVADLPYAAIGELLGCSEAAARQNVRAGLAALRRSPSIKELA